MDTFKKLLAEYVSFKSISTDAAYNVEIVKTVLWLETLFKDHDFKVEILRGPTTHPVIHASYHQSSDLKTILVYGHYDVQPAEGWKDDPFILREHEGRLLGRGVVDNKGQNLIHIFTALELIKENKLGCNISFLLEGNEETGNNDIAQLIQKHKADIKADMILISDGEIVGNTPTIESSLRGGGNVKVILKTAPNDLHSGIYGGAIPNAAQELSLLLSKIWTANNKVAIPGFYDDVEPITKTDRENNKIFEQRENVLEVSGVKQLLTEDNNDFYTQTGMRPTIEATGIHTGYTGVGYSNIVPAQAEVRLNTRLVANQNPEKIRSLIKDFILKNIPDYVSCEIQGEEFNEPVRVDVTSKAVEQARNYLTEAYGIMPLNRFVGGSIPVVADFKKILGIDALMIPLGNADCNMHGVDENFRIDLIEKGLKFSRMLLEKK